MLFFAAQDSFAKGSYVPILILLILGAVFSVVMVAMSRYIGRRILTDRKVESYECGMDPVGDARSRFSVKFYLVAILFILFDIEVIFLFPWAVRFEELGLFGLVEMGIFLGILLLGYVYILGAGALRWDKTGLVTGEDAHE